MIEAQIKTIDGIRWIVCDCGHKFGKLEDGKEPNKAVRIKCPNCRREVKV